MIIELEPTVFSDPYLKPVNAFGLDGANLEEFRIMKSVEDGRENHRNLE